MSRSELGVIIDGGTDSGSVGQFNPRQDTRGNRSSSQPAYSALEKTALEGAGVQYIGQYEKISKWIPRTSSAYDYDTAALRKSVNANRRNRTGQLAGHGDPSAHSGLGEGAATAGAAKAGPASYEEMRAELAERFPEQNAISGHLFRNETVQLQDFIMLTDMFAVPHLLTLIANSKVDQRELEYHLLQQIDHQDPEILRRNIQKPPEVSLIIPYNGGTVAFVVSILSCFGLSQLKFCKSATGQRVCKVRLTGMQISQEELNGIVQVVEHTFAKGQKQPFRRTQTLEQPKVGPAADLLQDLRAHNTDGESAGGSAQEVDLGGLPVLAGAMGRGESQLSSVEPPPMDDFAAAHIPKQKYTKMEILAIQNVLSRDYHFLKWHLVEVLELQERELNSVAFKSAFSDSVNQLMEQEANLKLGVKISPHDTTKMDTIHIINLQQMMVKQTELREHLGLPGPSIKPAHELSPE